MILFLDWAKAFDRINPASLLLALERFGLPREFVNMIGGIYKARRFFIVDHSVHRMNTTKMQGLRKDAHSLVFYSFWCKT